MSSLGVRVVFPSAALALAFGVGCSSAPATDAGTDAPPVADGGMDSTSSPVDGSKPDSAPSMDAPTDSGTQTDTTAPTDTAAPTEGGIAEGGTVDGGTAEGGTAEGGIAEGGIAEGGTVDGGTADTWTIFVYGHADHNLSNSLYIDISKMERARLGTHMTVIVMADWDASRGFATGTQWFRIRGNGMPRELLRTDPEQNLDDPAVLSAAIAEAFRTNPASHYGLVLWDHGGAWQGGFGGDSQNGTIAPRGISLPVLGPALRAGLRSAGITRARPLEFLAFDTCLMAGAEVVYSMRDLAQLYVANAELDYGSGWAYDTTLTYLSANPGATMRDFGAAEGARWDALHATAGAEDAALRSHADLDLTRVDALATATRALADYLLAGPASMREDFARRAYPVLPPYSIEKVNGAEPDRGLRDFGQLLASVENAPMDATSAALAHDARAALNDMVIFSTQGTLRAAAMQSGVHIAMPMPVLFNAAMRTQYSTLASDWSSATNWGRLLASVADTSDAMPPDLTVSGVNLATPSAAMRPGVDVTSNTVDLAELVVRVARVVSPGQYAIYGEVGRVAATTATTNLMASWDGTIVSIPAMGGGTQPVTVLRMFGPTRSIEGLCDLNDRRTPSPCSLLYEEGATAVTSVLRTVAGLPSVDRASDLAMRYPGASFIPLVAVENSMMVAGTPLRGTPSPFPMGASIPLTRTPAPADNYAFTTVAFDYFGNFNAPARYTPFTLAAPIAP